MSMQGASRETEEKVSRYVGAIQSLESAERAKNRAECELHNAENDLIKHLLPKKPDESMAYGIWVNGGGRSALGEGDVLLRISKKVDREWSIQIDKQGRSA
ncbi:MAG: hypothetical protein HQL97_00505 [Magnetococcales bacterium]|nr:hypothetical protein [Magnetococcales bacterium]